MLILGGAASVVLGAIVTTLILKAGPWALNKKIEETVKTAVKDAFKEEMKPMRARVAELEHWRREIESNGHAAHEEQR